MNLKPIGKALLGTGAVAVVIVALTGAFTGGDPEHPYAYQGPERVDLPGIGSVYYFKLHGHDYVCNPRGEMVHADSCPCKQQPEKPPVK